MVHHIIVYVDDHKGGDRPGRRLAHLCGYAPGDMPSVYPAGTAKKVPAGADFVFEIHYTPIGRVRTDRSQVGLIFAKAPVTRQAFTVGIAEDKFLIPAHQDNVAVAVVDDRRPGDAAAQLHAAHAPARQRLSIHLAPSRQAAETLLSVPAYDFGWQSYYVLAKPIDAAQGDAHRLPGALR